MVTSTEPGKNGKAPTADAAELACGRREEAGQNGLLIHQKVLDVRREIGFIPETNRNAAIGGTKFRSVRDVVAEVARATLKHGVIVSTKLLAAKAEMIEEESPIKGRGKKLGTFAVVSVRVSLIAADGSSVSAESVCSATMSGTDFAAAAALSGAYKEALCQVLTIPTREMVDPNDDRPKEELPKPNATKPAAKPALQAPPKAAEKPTETQAAADPPFDADPPPPASDAKSSQALSEKCGQTQRDKIVELCQQLGWDAHQLKQVLGKHPKNFASIHDMTVEDAAGLIAMLKGKLTENQSAEVFGTGPG